MVAIRIARVIEMRFAAGDVIIVVTCISTAPRAEPRPRWSDLRFTLFVP